MSERPSSSGDTDEQPVTPAPEAGASPDQAGRPVMPARRPSPGPAAQQDAPSAPADPAEAAAQAPPESAAARAVAGQATTAEPAGPAASAAPVRSGAPQAPSPAPRDPSGAAPSGAVQPDPVQPGQVQPGQVESGPGRPAGGPQPDAAPQGAPRPAPAAPDAEDTVRVPPLSEQRTQVMSRVTPAANATPAGGASEQTARIDTGAGSGTAVLGAGAPGPGGPGGPRDPGGPGSGDGGGDGGGDGDEGRGSGRRRPVGLIVAAAALGVLVLGYVGDLALSSGSVPRGVVVAGQQIGGMSRAQATEALQSAIEPRSSAPVPVQAGEVRTEIDPKAAGLQIDYARTLDEAGEQPLNPFTRVASFFTTREVGVVNSADDRAVRTALEQMAPLVMKEPKEGSIQWQGVTPTPVAPEPGQQLDVDAAVGVVEQQWASGEPVQLPLIVEQAVTTPADVQKAIDEVALPAVSGPLTVTGEGANATITPEDITKALSFTADPEGAVRLKPVIAVKTLEDSVSPQLASTEKPGVDAQLDFAANPPRVVPSQDGRGIDYEATFANVLPILTGQGERTVAAIYANEPAEITTADLESLGNATEISTFTTGGFAADSGLNIKRAAESVNNKIVAPGETFSLNAVSNPRNAANGYVEAGIIEDGHPARGVGGGVSQLATTLYNASYFAGMTDVEHKEHSYYISRYPVAREATVFNDLIDVKFRNDGPSPVLIRTSWTPSNVTVSFFGQKVYDVTSATGPRTNPTQPQVVNIPAGQPCSPSKGSPGFTATDTRTMRNVQTGETTSKTRTVKYNPQPIVQCGG
ncbi:VanW family protein [Pseudonocardia spirodelae]|uniref:VanW family protein n=1 Tax=Pseudonocardia spirodelae TaxID=3133431 RepID=A0ABU8TCW0_9PSEU